MALKKSTLSPAVRLDMGAAILLAAETHSTPSIRRRLDAFTAAHRRYANAQRRVEAADEQQHAAHARVAARDAAQDAAVEALARALVNEGQTRWNPFAPFVTDSPSALKQMSPGEKAQALYRLVAALRSRNMVSKATLQGGQAAEKAARAVEAALAPLEHLQETSRKARQRRDGIGETWDAALAALKRGARAAVDDGAPGLYDALFGRFVRPTRKKKAQPAPAQQSAVTATPSASPQAVDAAT